MVFYDAVLGRHDTNLFGRPIASSSGQLLGHLVKHGDCSFNVIVMRSFFQSMPLELEESARMDGSGSGVCFVDNRPVVHAGYSYLYLVLSCN